MARDNFKRRKECLITIIIKTHWLKKQNVTTLQTLLENQEELESYGNI